MINWSIKKRTGYTLAKLDVAEAASKCAVPVLLGCANADTLVSPAHRCAT
jgi:cephalosporin-C deacetylase-like acetyl esterase